MNSNLGLCSIIDCFWIASLLCIEDSMVNLPCFARYVQLLIYIHTKSVPELPSFLLTSLVPELLQSNLLAALEASLLLAPPCIPPTPMYLSVWCITDQQLSFTGTLAWRITTDFPWLAEDCIPRCLALATALIWLTSDWKTVSRCDYGYARILVCVLCLLFYSFLTVRSYRRNFTS